ncbi:MAG: hypothetical protein AB2L14_18945 [Candidatus Xenobiia bacterium LiM19]
MPELGFINPEQKLACPHCGAFLGNDDIEMLIKEESTPCLACGQFIKLPDQVIEALKRSRYLGKSLDITM